MKIANILYANKFSQTEATNILLQTLKGRERGINYVSSIVEKVFILNPPQVLSTDYEESLKIADVRRMIERKQQTIKEYKVNAEYDKVMEAIDVEDKSGIYNIEDNFDQRINYYLSEKKKEDDSAKLALPCITESLSKYIPVYGKNLILFAGQTGTGKSTICANIAAPILEVGKRVAYISTEEKAEDIITRVLCLQNGWNYANERNWTPDLKIERDVKIAELVRDDNFVVFDSYTNGWDEEKGVEVPAPNTTTLEGMQIVLERISKSKKPFDTIIVDYISKVGTSIKKYNQAEWQTMFQAMKHIEEWNKESGIPAIVFTQLKETEDENPAPFKSRIPGSKRILDLVTCAVELKTDYESKLTVLKCHKIRKGVMFTKALKFVNGRYIDVETPEE